MRYDVEDAQMRRAGAGWAVPQQNSGLVIAASRAFFRASEADDGFDWNNDGDQSDFVLFRTPVTVCSTTNMGTTANLTGEPTIYDDGLFGAVFFAAVSALVLLPMALEPSPLDLAPKHWVTTPMPQPLVLVRSLMAPVQRPLAPGPTAGEST